MQSYIRPNNCL